MKNNRSSLKTRWYILSLPPVIFLLTNVLALIYFGAQRQTNPVQITQVVAGAMAYVTLTVLVVLPGLLLEKRADHLSRGDLVLEYDRSLRRLPSDQLVRIPLCLADYQEKPR